MASDVGQTLNLTLPKSLTDCPHWVLWHLEQRNGQQTKVPYHVSGRQASTTDPNTWATFGQVLNAMNQGQGYSGIGFVFTNSGLTGIDLDHCVENGTIQPWAKNIIEWLASYAEISPSGRGVHIIVKGVLPDDNTRRRKDNIEMYSTGRYFTVTGKHIADTPTDIQDRQDVLLKLHSELFPKPEPEPRQHKAGGFDGSDEDLLSRARQARNGGKFSALFDRGDVSLYNGDDSAADLALCIELAFWTPDPDRIDRLFRQSSLCREKWSSRVDYRDRTIAAALARQTEHFGETSKTSKAKTFHLTDAGNAERLTETFGDILIFAPLWQRWLVWNEGRWDAETGPEQTERRALLVVRAMYAEAAATEDVAERQRLADWAKKSESNGRVQAMLSLAQHMLAHYPREFDIDSYMYKCKNGTLDLRTGRLREHRPEDMVTKFSPVEYDANARLDLWDHFLDTVTDGDQEKEAFLQRAIGYSLSGDTREEKLFFVHGGAATGKSTFIEAVRATLGDYAVIADFETFLKRREVGQIRNDIARLHGARFVASVEVDEGKRLAEGLVKVLTGGDSVASRFLYKESFEFRPQFKLWLAANHAPRVRDDDAAIWRRIIRIPFEHEIPEADQDPKVKATLRDPQIAGPAIRAWAVKGCLAWQKHGLAVPENDQAGYGGI